MCLESFEKDVDNSSYKTFEKRLSSFKSWKGKIDADTLAGSGFYFTTIQDACKCFYCGVEIFMWDTDDCPIYEHYKWSKNCDLVKCILYVKNKQDKKLQSGIVVNCNMLLCASITIINIFVSMYYKTQY